MNGAPPDLPRPGRGRWQPLRAGLLDLFFYDYQEFWFRDGRLLLRGNNGTGKSKVLALTLPFLLDGRCIPARVEPDGDAQKKVEWNLLLGDRYNERSGCTWLEFGRLREDATEEFFTVGCGMKAVRGRPLATWFFVTDLRVAGDFSLLDGHRRPLGRDRLREVLGDRGEVFDSAARHRRAVDEKLFQLGEARYEALLSLLIQLRQPQLSKRPDERSLSRALTEALPPLDAGVLREVAEAFRNLEAERRELDGLREAAAAVEQFREHYRLYARIAARRRAARLRTAHSRYEKASSEHGRARRDHARAAGEEQQVGADIRRARADLDAARARERTLRESPEMRDAQALHRAEDDAREKARTLEQAAADLASAAEEVERRRHRSGEIAARCAAARRKIAAAAEALAVLAQRAGIDTGHARALEALTLPNGTTEASGSDARIPATRESVEIIHARRAAQIEHLQRLNTALGEVERERVGAQQRWQEAQDEAERLAEDRAEAERAATAAGTALAAAYVRWLEQVRELAVADAGAVLAAFEDWAPNLEGENPVSTAARDALEAALVAIAAARAALERDQEEREQVRNTLVAERERLEAGKDRIPPPPHTRPEGVREARAGAPFRALVDFRDAVPEARRAAAEAALEAAGLLDAWVLPGGEVLDSGTWDVVLTANAAGEHGAEVPELTLDSILLPAVDRADARADAVSDETVRALLVSIGWGESSRSAWVDEHGRWRLGPARGAWGKAQAEYLGRGAREAARRRRLAELAAEIAALEAIIAGLRSRLGDLDARAARLDTEWRSLPEDEPLRAAHRRVAELLRALGEQQQRVARAAERLAAARAAVEERGAERDTAAADLGLPAAPGALSGVQAALADYRLEAGAFWPALAAHWDGLAGLREAHMELDRSEGRCRSLEERRTAAERTVRESAAVRDALRETVGEAVAAVERCLAETVATIDSLETQLEGLREKKERAGKRVAAAATEMRGFIVERRERSQSRDEAIAALRELAELGLLAAAFPERDQAAPTGEWSTEQAVQLARALEKDLHEVEDAEPAWQAQQQRLIERIEDLKSALSRHGHEAGAEPHADLLVVRVVFQSRSCEVGELARLISAEMRERSELLDARERELLEEHLVNDLASHLQVRIQDAEVAAAAMNEELERRPTGTGMKLRLRWKALGDGEEWLEHTAPDGLNEARRRLLRQSAQVWSPDDRRAVGTFLKKCIDDARAAEEAAALQGILERALDYRYWHRFVVERWQDGAWRPAYGPASGGERALVVTIPLFAAASSHYTSAAAHAPRLVLLDEAFAGIDDESRARCMGLLARFDMDVVMTSEREWGCYAEVPGLAICQLTRREGVDAVHVSPWWWDGHRRVRAGECIPDLEVLEQLGAAT